MWEMPEMPAHLARALDREMARWMPPLTGVDADDLRQEGHLAWWQVWQGYDPARGVPLAAYAWPRVLGQLQDVRRRATRRGAMTYYPLAREPRVYGPPCREVWLWRRVNRLPPRPRLVIIRRYWSAWSLDQIARHLGVSPQRVFALHRTALRQLRRALVLDLLECG